MKSKWILFLGIALLTLGIVLKRFENYSIAAVTLIIVGVLCKVFYIIQKARSGEYKPGIELLFLIIGLLLFASGTYLKNNEPTFTASFLVILGILFKITFIVMIIRNIRLHRKLKG